MNGSASPPAIARSWPPAIARSWPPSRRQCSEWVRYLHRPALLHWPNARERERAADKWHYDADERTKNLKALERGGPVMFEGFSQPLVPVGYEQQTA